MDTKKGITTSNKLQQHLATSLCAVVLTLSSTAAHATILLNDNFSDGQRNDQNLTSSSAWFSSGNASTLSAATNALVLSTSTTSRQALTYFTDSGAQNLSVGDSLSVSFTLSETAFSGSSIFRLGLYNSGGTRVSADSTGNTNAAFTNYTGYSMFTSFTSNLPTGTTLRSRTGADTSLFSTTANVALTGNAATLNLTDSSVYNFTLTITSVSATDVTINMLVKDSTNTTTLMNFTSTDSGTPFTSFDTLAVYGSNGATTAAAITLDNVVVNYTAVPEPASCGLAALGAGALLWRMRRRQA